MDMQFVSVVKLCIKKLCILFLNILFPRQCELCNNTLGNIEAEYLCSNCGNNIEFLEGMRCRICCRPVGIASNAICSECVSRKVYFSECFASGHYDDGLRKLIGRFKYGKKRYLAAAIGKRMVQSGKNLLNDNTDIITYVPIHWHKRWKRGFNQSEELAQVVSKEYNIQLKELLSRIKRRHGQVSLGRDDRKRNVEDIFEVVDKELVKGKSIMLVDDVITTGSTVNACAKTLIKSGAVNVRVIVAAAVF
ncbi:MAG: ComF family protein [Candidatus Theseobacter exili]|nr:ComF family protein [Candidatus Theseobacter exili]